VPIRLFSSVDLIFLKGEDRERSADLVDDRVEIWNGSDFCYSREESNFTKLKELKQLENPLILLFTLIINIHFGQSNICFSSYSTIFVFMVSFHDRSLNVAITLMKAIAEPFRFDIWLYSWICSWLSIVLFILLLMKPIWKAKYSSDHLLWSCDFLKLFRGRIIIYT